MKKLLTVLCLTAVVASAGLLSSSSVDHSQETAAMAIFAHEEDTGI